MSKTLIVSTSFLNQNDVSLIASQVTHSMYKNLLNIAVKPTNSVSSYLPDIRI